MLLDGNLLGIPIRFAKHDNVVFSAMLPYLKNNIKIFPMSLTQLSRVFAVISPLLRKIVNKSHFLLSGNGQ
jgi:hypothetical protein